MEGPSVRVAADQLQRFAGSTIISASGNARIDMARVKGTVHRVYSVGKNLFFRLDGHSLKLHFLMYGRYRVDKPKDAPAPRLVLQMDAGTFYFYNGSVMLLPNRDVDTKYDETLDILNATFDKQKVLGMMSRNRDAMICDVLMDQGILPGVGNMIKNEALFNARVTPTAIVKDLGPDAMQRVLDETVAFYHVFFASKKNGTPIRASFKVYQKKKCTSCGQQIVHEKTGTGNRVSYHCPRCQPPCHM